MGVHGLWQLIEPSGRPVPLETLESKVLAVDISIWLHQAVKGFQDSKGAPVPNAHLLGIYHRVCKLLYFKVKPVFIFDGGVPVLKKQTIAKRNQQKSRNISEAERLQKQILSTLLKHSAVSKILSEKTKASLTLPPEKKHENMYVLPPAELDSTVSSSEEDDTEDTDSSPSKHWDLHTIDMTSTYFRSLPVDVRHEILTDLKETRKQNSWGRLHELPKQSDEFSGYQMKRLLKRQAVQSALEDAEKEMGGHSLSLAELESILKDHGVATINDVGKRIASDENTRFLYIKDVKQALDKARKEQQKLEEENDGINKDKSVTSAETTIQQKNKAEREFENDLQKAIALSLVDEPSTSKTDISKNIDDERKMEFSFLENFNDGDFQSDSNEEFEEVCPKKMFSSAHNYMIEYSGLTPSEIAKIMKDKNRKLLKINREKKHTKKIVNINVDVSDSDDSNEFIEVPIKRGKPDSGLTDSNYIEKLEEKSISPLLLDQNKSQVIPDNKSNDVTVNEVDKEMLNMNKGNEIAINKSKEFTDVVPPQITVISDISNSLNITEGTKSRKDTSLDTTEIPITYQNIEYDSNNTGEVATHDDSIFQAKPIINSETEKLDETEKPDLNVDKAITNIVTSNNENNDENLVSIEIMSDSGESDDSVELVEVSESSNNKKSMEIIVDPNQTVDDENDLFGDIFKKDDNSDKKKPLEIVIDPQTKLTDDLFSDVFEDKAVVESSFENDSNKKVDMKEEMPVIVHDNKNSPKERREQEIPTFGEFREKKSEEVMETNTNDEVKRSIEEIRKVSLSVEEMKELKKNLQREKIDLMVEKSTRERMATNITDQMYQEAQELLELFGVPYIVAPMEAEAQCAFLDTIELTDGTITDDSDIWLFGGRTVYKNFFNQSKYVMEFKAENIKHHFKLTREQMILLALLVGSDYTTGIQGIGPVTALEILATFPPSLTKEFTMSHAELISGLKEFQSWINKGKTAGPGRSSLKNKLKNVSITDHFPSLQVVQAYMEPTVDTSREKFSWGKPDFEGLTDFARRRFGWSSKKTIEILKPVIKRMEEKQIQTSIKDYFKTTQKVLTQDAKDKMSKRVKSAIEKIGKTREELIAEEIETLSKIQKKKSPGKRPTENSNKSESIKKKSSPEVSEVVNSKGVKNKTKLRSTRKKPGADSAEVTKNKMENRTISSSKKPRKNTNMSEQKSSSDVADLVDSTSLELIHNVNEEDELQKYENIAKELKRRRQQRNELPKKIEAVVKKTQTKQQLVNKRHDFIPENSGGKEKQCSSYQTSVNKNQPQNFNEEISGLERCKNTAIDLKERRLKKDDSKHDIIVKKQAKSQVKQNAIETIPQELEGDEEIQFFQATTSSSLKRLEEIDREIRNELGQEAKKKCLPNFHKKEIIHQKLRDKSDLLRNKMKAIEVFRKSKKGPGYVEKRKRKINLPKEDADLSENSSDTSDE